MNQLRLANKIKQKGWDDLSHVERAGCQLNFWKVLRIDNSKDVINQSTNFELCPEPILLKGLRAD